MYFVHSSESEITNIQSLWQFLFYSADTGFPLQLVTALFQVCTCNSYKSKANITVFTSNYLVNQWLHGYKDWQACLWKTLINHRYTQLSVSFCMTTCLQSTVPLPFHKCPQYGICHCIRDEWFGYHIPQMEQHDPKGQMLFHLGIMRITCWISPLTPGNSLPHPIITCIYSTLCYSSSKILLLGNIQVF